MREVIDVGEDVLWYVSIFLQTKLKYLKGHRFILWREKMTEETNINGIHKNF